MSYEYAELIYDSSVERYTFRSNEKWRYIQKGRNKKVEVLNDLSGDGWRVVSDSEGVTLLERRRGQQHESLHEYLREMAIKARENRTKEEYPEFVIKENRV